MTLIAPKAGEILMLQYIVNLVRDSSDHNVLHVYENDVSPSESSTTSSFTEPSGAIGYDPITLVGSLWTIQQIGDVTTALYSQQTFTFTTGVEVFGYFVTDTSGSIIWAERFLTDGSFELPSGGGTIAVEPKLTLE